MSETYACPWCKFRSASLTGLARHLSELQCHLKHLERRKQARERAERPPVGTWTSDEERALFERLSEGE